MADREKLPRPRGEHGRWTSFVAEPGKEAKGWTTIAVDRGTRRRAVGQAARQDDAARNTYEGLYTS